MKIAQGTKVLGLTTSRLGEISLNVPSVKEQTQIAQFLSALEAKITLVAEALEAVKEFKKGLLQQLFV